jgi:sugar lactone lactonase YvrE
VPTSAAVGPDRQGRLLATELNQGGLLAPATVPGALVRVSDNGRTVTTLPVPGLYQPTGVAVSANGTVYVSNFGASNTVSSRQSGEIVKITGLS